MKINGDDIKGWLVMLAMIVAAIIGARMGNRPAEPDVLSPGKPIAVETQAGRNVNLPLLPETVWSGAGRGGK